MLERLTSQWMINTEELKEANLEKLVSEYPADTSELIESSLARAIDLFSEALAS